MKPKINIITLAVNDLENTAKVILVIPLTGAGLV